MKNVKNLVENYLPNFIQKWVDWSNDEYCMLEIPFDSDDYDGDPEQRFLEDFFPEALAAYTAAVARATRAICVEVAEAAFDENEDDPGQAMMDALASMGSVQAPTIEQIKEHNQ